MRRQTGWFFLVVGCLSLVSVVVAEEEVIVGIGQQRPLSVPGLDNSSDVGFKGPFNVYNAGGGQLRITGSAAGTGYITARTSAGKYEYSVMVVSGDPANTIEQMKALLGDVEPPLGFKVVGGRVLVKGSISAKQDIPKLKQVKELFPDAVYQVSIDAAEQLVDVTVTLVEVQATSANSFSLLDIDPSGAFTLTVPILPDSSRKNIVASLSATGELMKAIQALVSSGKGKIVAQPRVVTMDQEEASINVGGQIPYPVVGPAGTPGVQYLPYGIQLRATPELRTREIILDLSMTSSEAAPSTGQSFSLTSRDVKMKVAVQKGKSLVFARLYSIASSGNTKVGCLFPLFGTSSAETRRELLVVVTPNVAGDSGIKYDDFELIKPADTGKQ